MYNCLEKQVFIYLYIHTYIRTPKYIQMNDDIFTYECMYVYMYVCIIVHPGLIPFVRSNVPQLLLLPESDNQVEYRAYIHTYIYIYVYIYMR